MEQYMITGDQVDFMRAVARLNRLGFVVREQCLSDDQLFAGNPDWLTAGVTPSRQQLETIETTQNKSYMLTLPLGLYVCLHLQPLVKACIASVIEDLKSLLGSHEKTSGDNPVSTLLQPLLVLQKALSNRISELKTQAESTAKAANESLGQPVSDVPARATFRCLPPEVRVSRNHLTLIWDEASWQPSHIYDHRPKAETLAHNTTDAKVVQAWQVSQGSQIRFVRDCWLLDEEASNNTIEVLDGYVPINSLSVKPGDGITPKAPEKTSGEKA